jgi:pyruvate kinase
VGLDYKELPRDVKPGDTAAAQRRPDRAHGGCVRGEAVHTTVKLGGELSNNKGINKQGGGLTAPALTAKDMDDIRTAMSFQADYVAVSFPKNATDMEMARQLCNVAASRIPPQAGLIAKIERAEAIPHLEEILRASDGIMVARGDLAVEVGNAAVPALQKKMIRMAREHDKVVITATQMMESMITNPVPTRAEVSDVANAVLDGTDAVMLSAPRRPPASTRWKPWKRWPRSALLPRRRGPPADADFTGRPSPASTSPSPWARCSRPTTWAPRPSWR